jgi:hypothetical protein
MQVDKELLFSVHLKLLYILHISSQPSPKFKLPSSQSSEGTLIPSPHFPLHVSSDVLKVKPVWQTHFLIFILNSKLGMVQARQINVPLMTAKLEQPGR